MARPLALVLIVTSATGPAGRAQDVFNGHDVNGKPLDDTYTSNSKPTGTQGVVGNPFCPPPVEVINGKRVTPRNWSCGYSQIPPTPGRKTVIGPGANACKPYGTGGYDFCQNPKGTQLPAGCTCGGGTQARTFTPHAPGGHLVPNGDGTYRTVTPPAPSGRGPPAGGDGAPGSYVQNQGPPGSYIQNGDGPPGSYLPRQGEGAPGSYIQNQGQGPPGSYIQNGDGPPGSYLPRQGEGAPGSYIQNQGQGPPGSYLKNADGTYRTDYPPPPGR